MRALLIYPPISKLERYSSSIGNSGGCQIPLGVYSIASYIRSHGHEVDVCDAEAHRLTTGALADRIGEYRPDVVGVSSTTVAFHRAVELAREIKARFPRKPIVLGGPHISSNVDHAMAQECFDIGVLREGEITFLHLLEALEGGGELGRVPGLAYRREGKLVLTGDRPPLEDLDSLPFPAIDLIPDLSVYNPPPCNYRKAPVANIITSRGCPNQCTFCDQSIFGRSLRQRSAENIAAEIESLHHTYGVREVAFVDDTFTIGKKRIREIFTLLDRHGIRLPWTCMSRINTVDREILGFMREMGCWHISFGIESGNEEILRAIKKSISLKEARQVVSWCSELGIKTKGFFIIGHPGETRETIDQSIRTALEMPLDDVVVTLNTPIPGTRQYAEAERFGSLDTTDWSSFNMWRPVFVPRGLDREILLSKQREFYRRFYLRPRIIVRYLLSFLSRSGPKRFLSLLRTVPYLFQKERTA